MWPIKFEIFRAESFDAGEWQILDLDYRPFFFSCKNNVEGKQARKAAKETGALCLHNELDNYFKDLINKLLFHLLEQLL